MMTKQLRRTFDIPPVFGLALALIAVLVLTGCGKTPETDQPKTETKAPETIKSPAGSGSTASTPVVGTNADQSFTVLAYNVENLFDIDGKSLFEDYAADKHDAKKLFAKVNNIVKILATFNQGKGPEIVLFQEFESDQSPSKGSINYDAILEKYRFKSLAEMLTEPVADEVKDFPAEVFLLKACEEAKLEKYNISVAEFRPDPLGREVAHVNVTLSQFPIEESRTHQSPGARGTLEVVHRIGDHKLHTFGNHWKSGASNPKEEPVRIGNAEVVRKRIDEILTNDPNADIILGGDFNSQYNQQLRYPSMKKTAIDQVLGSQGDEQAVQSSNGPILYNLWYEVPPSDRRSDAYNGEWGTLMNIMITRGLYDHRGVQYIDNSFKVTAIENVNSQKGSGLPIRWRTILGTAIGFSDHLPIQAQFKIVNDNDPKKFVVLTNPGKESSTGIEKSGIRVSFPPVDVASLRKTTDLGSDAAIQKMEQLGELMLVEATVSAEKPMRIKLFDEEMKIWAFDKDMRIRIYEKFPVGSNIKFVGELEFHEGMWQFVIHDEKWIMDSP